MANLKLTELTQITSAEDGSLFYVVDPSRIAGDQSVAISKEDLIALIGTSNTATNPVENEYADIAEMLADQANQTEGFFEYVIDASADPDVTSGEAYYEKLSASTAALGNYRRLSDEEVQVVTDSNGFKVFRVQEISDTSETVVSNGRIKIEYDNVSDKVTGFLFNRRYSDIISNIVALDSDFDYVINVYNRAQRKYHLAKITGFSTVNTDYILASVDDKIDRTEFAVDNRVEVNIDVDNQGSGGGSGNLESVTQNIDRIDVNIPAQIQPLAPLTIPTYDGSGQTTHPSVVYFKDGFGVGDYNYWMAHTPYPNANTQLENPSIVASNDGITWVEPAGISNPIVPWPGGSDFNNDPVIFKGLDGKLWMYHGGTIALYYLNSDDGVNWSTPVAFPVSPTPMNVSLSVVINENNNGYYVYGVATSNYTMYRYATDTPIATTVNLETCVVNNLPVDKQMWHIEVRKYNEEWHLFADLSRVGTNSEDTDLYFGVSYDGINFTLSDYPLAIRNVGTWTSGRAYKASAILLNNDKYSMWLSAESSNDWRIGYTEVSLNGIVNTTNAELAADTNRNPNVIYQTEDKIYVGSNQIGGSTPVIQKTYEAACSDETTDLTTGTSVVTFRMPYAMTLTEVRASVNTAPTGSTIIVDINENGSSILSTKISIDAGEKTSTTAATPPVISDTSLADDAEITIDIDQIGSTIAGTGLKITLIGT